jgi:hypothetical protein
VIHSWIDPPTTMKTSQTSPLALIKGPSLTTSGGKTTRETGVRNSRLGSLWACLILGIAAAQPTSGRAGLVARYRLDGDATDASGNGNHGTLLQATPTNDRAGKARAAFAFDGTDDYISVPYAAPLQPAMVTLALWAQRNNWAAAGFSGGEVRAGNTQGGGYELYVDPSAGTAGATAGLCAQPRQRLGHCATPLSFRMIFSIGPVPPCLKSLSLSIATGKE